MPRVLILRTAGTNCDRETAYAFERAGATVEARHLRELVESPDRVLDYGVLVFPGGFTYGDDLGAGTIFASLMRRGLLPRIVRHVERGGLVLGICNGFQILVKSGLLPATDGPCSPGEATLAGNESHRFECRWVWLEATSDLSPFLRRGDRIHCPVAHAEGRFVTRDEATLDHLWSAGQVVLRYTGPDGEPDPAYPLNPNGSARAVAGVCDPTGRILGLMPHPERHLSPVHHARWTREGLATDGDGLALFRNAVAAV
ncbi:MAG: phosphoribosylformylglycinamidine synthase I [Planctomycetes bacterium]|jgi:phosphoribosylformylglycinamidine synthase|nr:phosphoribosylformylglycinamidine synthase I [Planctomycetota bacterium]